MVLFDKLKEKKIYIILIIILSLFVGIVCSLKLAKKEYIAVSTFIIVETENVEEGKVESIGSLEISDKLIATLKEIIKNDTTASKIKSELSLNVENSEISKNVSMKVKSKNDTVEISVKSSDEKNAIEINNKMIEIFGAELKGIYSKSDIHVIDNSHISKVVSSIPIVLSGILSIVIGMIIGVAYIAISMVIEKNIRINKNIEKAIDLKKIIDIPKKSEKKTKFVKSELISYESQKSLTSKAFKKLRSNLQFITVNNAEKKIILVTSPLNGEGKSYVSANMATSFAEAGKKVILIDADMSNGRQSEIFNIPNNLGLSNYLSNLDSNGIEIQKLTNNFINETAIKNLNLITSGTIPPNTSELLASDRLGQLVKDLSVFYDIVIIDGTSTLKSMDSLILARVATSTVLVSDYRKTKKEDILKAKRDIQNVGGKPIGIIINKAKVKKEKISNEEIKIALKTWFLNVKAVISKHIDKIKEKRLQKRRKLLMEAHIEREIKRQSKIIVESAKNSESEVKGKLYSSEKEENIEDDDENNIEESNDTNNYEDLENEESLADKEEISSEAILDDNEKDLIVLKKSKNKDERINLYLYKLKKDISNVIRVVKPVVKTIIVKTKVGSVKVFVTTKNIIKKSAIAVKSITIKVIEKSKPVIKKVLSSVKNVTLKGIKGSKNAIASLVKNIRNAIKERKEKKKQNDASADEDNDQLSFDTMEMKSNVNNQLPKQNEITHNNERVVVTNQSNTVSNNTKTVEINQNYNKQVEAGQNDKILNNIKQEETNKISNNEKQVETNRNDNILNIQRQYGINPNVRISNAPKQVETTRNDKVDIKQSEINSNTKNDIKEDKKVKEEKLESNAVEIEKTDTAVLVIVDAEKGCCRVFGKCYYTEKLIKGVDQTDGINKNQYSSRLVNSRIFGLMSLYSLNKKQAQRIDTLIYTTLCDYDDRVWINKKTISNRADAYVLSMAKEYEKLEDETKEEYETRCKRLRQEALQAEEIDIEYKLDNIWKSNKITILDKFAVKHYANIYEVKASKRNYEEIAKSNQNKNFYIDIIQKVKSRLETSTYTEEDDDGEETENSGVYELEEGEEKFSEIAWKKEEKLKRKEERERKREERKEKLKEKLNAKKEIMLEKKEELAQKKQEKNRKQEELKRQKEEEKERQREEARIEEQLLGDNLYPKTKNNRSLQ